MERAVALANHASPAHAGIDLVIPEPHPGFVGFPRTRGDRPEMPVASSCASWLPPHTRG